MAKHFIALKGPDLYCYNSHEKTKVKFMHSLTGSFATEMAPV